MKRAHNIVAMPIETTARELLPKLFLAIKLAEQGFVSYLGVKTMIHEVALKSDGVIYLDKGYHSGQSDPLFRELRRAGALIVDLDEENGIDFQDFHMLNVRMPDQLFSLVDHILVWGQAQYDHLRANRQAFDAARISITGHPRFDLIKPEYRGLYADEAERLRRRHGPFILLNTNTKFGNNVNGRQFIIENYLSRVKGLIERLAYDDQRLEANLLLVRRLVQETPYRVVIRPHPEENIDTYRRALVDLPGAQVVYDGPPIHWLLAAEHVIHNHSTTGLEAAMLGKIPISYNPVAVDLAFVPWIPIACSLCLSTADEVVALISKDLAHWPKPPDVDDILKSYFSYDRCASRLVVEAIRRVAESDGRRTAGKGSRGGLGRYLAKLRVKGLLQSLRGGASMSPLARNKLNDLRPPIVRQRFDELLAQSAASRTVALETLHPLLYRVRPVGG